MVVREAEIEDGPGVRAGAARSAAQGLELRPPTGAVVVPARVLAEVAERASAGADPLDHPQIPTCLEAVRHRTRARFSASTTAPHSPSILDHTRVRRPTADLGSSAQEIAGIVSGALLIPPSTHPHIRQQTTGNVPRIGVRLGS